MTKLECIKDCRKTGSFIGCLQKCLGSGGATIPPIPTSLFSIVQKATGCSKIYIPDKHMDLPTDADMQRWLAKDQTDKKHYVATYWDCDDSARNVWCNIRNIALVEQKNIAFGVVWTAAHALCLYVNRQQQIIYIEPQTDKQTSIHSTPRFILF